MTKDKSDQVTSIKGFCKRINHSRQKESEQKQKIAYTNFVALKFPLKLKKDFTMAPTELPLSSSVNTSFRYRSKILFLIRKLQKISVCLDVVQTRSLNNNKKKRKSVSVMSLHEIVLQIFLRLTSSTKVHVHVSYEASYQISPSRSLLLLFPSS